jgi:gliding motility-associated lipoprotein GldH
MFPKRIKIFFTNFEPVWKSYYLCLLFFSLLLASCDTIDLYEKVVSIPKNKWASTYKPSFTFSINDTTTAYQLYFIIRHNEKYNYNNIWLNLYTKSPDGTVSKAPYEMPLATNEKGWLGTGMDDLYEHRIALTPLNRQFYFKKAGNYTFSVEQIMREDPLESVLNVGLRIEKK